MLNLSISTVSRALNNHPDIAEKTKEKVRELAKVLDYEPNTHAINLRSNNSHLFGVVLPSIANFFYQSFIATLEGFAREHGYSLLILQSADNSDIEKENIRLCKINRVSGIFVCITPLTKDYELFSKLEEQGIPIIFFDKVPSNKTCNKVCVADFSAAAQAAETLIRKKKQNVLALFGNANLSISKNRLVGFSETFALKAPKTNVMIDYAHSIEDAEKIVVTYFKKSQKPDSIFCMSDEILIGVMRTLQRKHISIPDEVGIIAISNGFIPKLYYPEISYIETSGSKLAELAFNRMMACIGGRTFVQELIVDATFCKGGSI
ncbi:MAG: LacI family transcriptional regulator [Chitinophagaceae bacterium]|nr:LacI family transcriptional regulator [Chitinophagaceae bacterium]